MFNGGVLIVNWSNFTAKELATYKSIFDKPPTLFGQPISDMLRVIGIKTPNTQACSAFSSRCLPYKFNESTYAETKTEEIQSKEPKEFLEIDLFKSPNWRKVLLGDITFSGNEIKLEIMISLKLSKINPNLLKFIIPLMIQVFRYFYIKSKMIIEYFIMVSGLMI